MKATRRELFADRDLLGDKTSGTDDAFDVHVDSPVFFVHATATIDDTIKAPMLAPPPARAQSMASFAGPAYPYVVHQACGVGVIPVCTPIPGATRCIAVGWR